MTDPNQIVQETGKAIADLPLWMWIVLALAGGFGEMWRASRDPSITWGEICRRVVLRAGASSLFGLATFMLAWVATTNPVGSAAMGILMGLIGADIASALYERWFAKRFGLSDEVAPQRGQTPDV